MAESAVRVVKIEDLITDPHNPNVGTERGLYMLDESLGRLGAGRSILIDANNVVIAGNKTLERAVDLGYTHVQVVQSDGTMLTAVQRPDMDLAAGGPAREMSLWDNRIPQASIEWEPAELDFAASQGVDLGKMWSGAELADLGVEWRADGGQPEAPEPQIDRAAELQEKWQVQRGEVWEIPSKATPGKSHRLMCGDSTQAEDVGRLMGAEKADMVFTDPPYSRDYTSRGEKGTVAKSGNFRTLIGVVGRTCQEAGAWYVKLPWYDAAAVIDALKPSHFIIWAKQGFGLGGGDFRPQHEVLLYGRTHGPCHAGDDVGDVWTLPIPFRGRMLHVAETPTTLIERAIRFSSNAGDVIEDLFLGSGTTIVAAEQTGRLCYGMEIEPKYCAASLQRLADMGLTPERID